MVDKDEVKLLTADMLVGLNNKWKVEMKGTVGCPLHIDTLPASSKENTSILGNKQVI